VDAINKTAVKSYQRFEFQSPLLTQQSIYDGGCRSAMTSNLRIFLTPDRLRLRVLTVALLVGVMPMISKPSLLQQKCSNQVCCLGWYRAVFSELLRSMTSCLFDLQLLQPPQAKARFSSVVFPSLDIGIICSNSKD
jgi:hypothetical protein